MSAHTFRFSAKLQKFQEAGGWQFLVVPKSLAMQLRERYRPNHGGWGSLRVRATVGKTSWLTSIFWLKRGGYYLFIKKQVREAEALRLGKLIKATVTLINV